MEERKRRGGEGKWGEGRRWRRMGEGERRMKVGVGRRWRRRGKEKESGVREGGGAGGEERRRRMGRKRERFEERGDKRGMKSC